MNNLPCEIVQDLLPSYVDGLTHPVTTQAVQEHLEACPSCRDSHRRMSQKSEASDDSNWEKWQTFVKLNQKRRRRIRLRIILLGVLGLCTLLVLFAPLPTHTVRAYHGIRQSGGKEEPVTAKLDYWTFDFLLFARSRLGRRKPGPTDAVHSHGFFGSGSTSLSVFFFLCIGNRRHHDGRSI